MEDQWTPLTLTTVLPLIRLLISAASWVLCFGGLFGTEDPRRGQQHRKHAQRQVQRVAAVMQ